MSTKLARIKRSQSLTRRVRDVDVPLIMYGTAWKQDRTQELTFRAIQMGFRGIDTANQRKYYREDSVGAAIRAALLGQIVTRHSLFIQTKFTHHHAHDHRTPYDSNVDITRQVHQSIESSLVQLSVDYIDSYILHGPSTTDGITDNDFEAWRSMEEAVRTGKVKLIGLSNVSIRQLAALLDHAIIQPAFVQNRCAANMGWDKHVRELCRSVGIAYQAFSLILANDAVTRAEPLLAIARRFRKTPAQIIYRFAIDLGLLPITGTACTAHMHDNLGIFDFELTEDDVRAVLHLHIP
jgi:diketogulonate reductase-like aldo/keto reductase